MRILFFLSFLIAGFASSNALAQAIIKYDSLASLQGNFSFAIEINNLLGAELATGDFNGDGIQDLAYSASDVETSGKIKIKYGALGFETNTDTTSIIFSNPIIPLMEFGWELGSGDLNNDGIDDLIIGLPEYNEVRGRLYVIYGQNSWVGQTIDLSTISANEGFYVEGLTPAPQFDSGSLFGKGYAIGDLDGDNLNDLFVTAPIGRNNRDKQNERGYLIFGKAIQGNSTIGLDTLSTSSGVVFNPGEPGPLGVEGVGFEALFKDINGDGKDELIFSEHNTPAFGSMYVIFQNADLPDTLNLNDLDNLGFIIKGPITTRGFGDTFDFGDLNGDGLIDIIASSPTFPSIGSDDNFHAGGISIIFGKPGRFGGNSFSIDDITPSTSNPIDGIFIKGAFPEDNTGRFIEVEDFNNDGIDDLIFTAGIDNKEANVYSQNTLRVLLGTDWEQPNVLDLKDPDPLFPLIEITIDSIKFDAGFSIITEDLNNDQKPDIIFGTLNPDLTGKDVHRVQVLTNYVFDVEVPNGTIFFDGGLGTAEDPYLVSNSDHLNNIRDFMDNDFKLTQDLELQNDTNVGWVPFGYARDDYYMTGDTTAFSGCFDGGGKTISNLEMRTRDRATGFFAYVSGCVKNLNFESPTISYIPFEDLPDSIKSLPPQQLRLEIPRFVGTVAGNVEKTGLLENVRVTNTTIIEGSVGSVAGANYGTIIQAHGSGLIDDAFQAGGVVGVNFGSINQSSFEGSFGEIFGAVGGITAANIEGNITESFSKSIVDSTDIFGGVVAQYSYGIVENNYAEFQIKSQLTMGGIIGRFGNGGISSEIKDPLTIKNNYSFGILTVKTDEVEFYRGIIGQGFVSAEDSAALESRIGFNYWNKELFGEEDKLPFGIRVPNSGKTNAEMKKEATFESWDFSSIWSIEEGSSFPYLKKNPSTTKPGSDIATSTEQDELPSRVNLSQNYPNPFNPSTVISYELSETSIVSLDVFNMLGQKVQTIVSNTVQTSGNYSVTFNAQGLSSGVYIYQLKLQDGVTLTKRLTLIK